MSNFSNDDGLARFLSGTQKEIENEFYKLLVEKKDSKYFVELLDQSDNSSLFKLECIDSLSNQINQFLKEFLSQDDLNLVDLEGLGTFIPKLSRYSNVPQIYPNTETRIAFFHKKLCIENNNVLLYLTKSENEYRLEGFEFIKSSEEIIQKNFKRISSMLVFIYRYGVSENDLEKIRDEIESLN